jgi:hypothetical protein
MALDRQALVMLPVPLHPLAVRVHLIYRLWRLLEAAALLLRRPLLLHRQLLLLINSSGGRMGSAARAATQAALARAVTVGV